MADGALAELRLLLKEWERSFERINGRRPARSDASAEPSIKGLYRKYASLKEQCEKENAAPSENTAIASDAQPVCLSGVRSQNKRKSEDTLSGAKRFCSERFSPSETSPAQIERDDAPVSQPSSTAAPLREMVKKPAYTIRSVDEEAPLKITPQGFTISIQRCGQRLETEWPLQLTARLGRRISSSLGTTEFGTETQPGAEDPSAPSTSNNSGVNPEETGKETTPPEHSTEEMSNADPAKPPSKTTKAKAKNSKPRAPKGAPGNFVKLNINGKGSRRKFVSRACCKRPSPYGRKKFYRRNTPNSSSSTPDVPKQ